MSRLKHIHEQASDTIDMDLFAWQISIMRSKQQQRRMGNCTWDASWGEFVTEYSHSEIHLNLQSHLYQYLSNIPKFSFSQQFICNNIFRVQLSLTNTINEPINKSKSGFQLQVTITSHFNVSMTLFLRFRWKQSPKYPNIDNVYRNCKFHIVGWKYNRATWKYTSWNNGTIWGSGRYHHERLQTADGETLSTCTII